MGANSLSSRQERQARKENFPHFQFFLAPFAALRELIRIRRYSHGQQYHYD
jgi:hypothetical protein